MESNEVLSNRIAELMRKNSELQAHVDRLQRTTFDVVCASAILGAPIHEEESHKCLAASDAEVSAKAVEAAANELASIFTAPPGMHSPAVIKLNLIANQIRQKTTPAGKIIGELT